jgi:hypothetical protein
MKRLLRLLKHLFKPRYLLWFANLALALPWLGIGLLGLLGRLNNQPDPMPLLLVLALVVSIIVFVLGILAVILGFGLGIVSIFWALRRLSLGQIRGAIAVWSLLLASWLWFGLS